MEIGLAHALNGASGNMYRFGEPNGPAARPTLRSYLVPA